MQSTRETIIILVVTATLIALLLVLFVVLLLYFYQRKQIAYQKKIDSLKSEYEKSLLNTELEIQEQTMQHISREIHDNIGLSLTLAKLTLNTLDYSITNTVPKKIEESSFLIGKAIRDLSAISHSLNANVINSNGLIRALEEEAIRVSSVGKFTVNILVSGESVFLNDQKEILLFRILQEALHNILKYAGATIARIELHYSPDQLRLSIKDNGRGFTNGGNNGRIGSGLHNMQARTKILNGTFDVKSNTSGTLITVLIPLQR